MRQRCRGAQISVCANADEPRVDILPSCGFLQGDVTGPSLFKDIYSEQIAKRERSSDEEDDDAGYLHARCFFTGDTYDTSSTIFAGDITKRTVTRRPQEVIAKEGKASRMFTKGSGRHRDCHEATQRRTPGWFHWLWIGHVSSHIVQGEELAREHRETVSKATGSGYTAHMQLQQCCGEASPSPSSPSWMDGDGTFLEC